MEGKEWDRWIIVEWRDESLDGGKYSGIDE